jgi:hypothetical protein
MSKAVMAIGGSAFALTIAWCSVAIADDLVIRTRLSLAGSDRSVEETTHWTAGKRVIDGARRRIIIDYGHQTVTTLDKAKRTYRIETLQEVRLQTERITAFMRRGLRGLSSERRVGMGHAGFDPRPRFSLRASGRTERIAGHVARELRLEGGPVTGSVWVVADVRRPPQDRDWAPYVEQFGGLDIAGSKLAFAMARVRGWPVRTELATPADVIVRSEVVEIGSHALPEDLLAIPDDYRPDEAATSVALTGREHPH